MVYVSVGAGLRQSANRDSSECPSLQPPPPRDSLPTLLLLQPSYLEQLFRLMRTLGDMRSVSKNGVCYLCYYKNKFVKNTWSAREVLNERASLLLYISFFFRESFLIRKHNYYHEEYGTF